MTKKFKKKSVYSFLFIVMTIVAISVFGFAMYTIFDSPDRPAPVYYEPDTK